MSERTNQLRIRTPEGVCFSLLLAGPVSRCLAWIIDAFSIFLAIHILISIVSRLGILSYDLPKAIVFVLYFTCPIGYAIIMEWYWNGQTLGKRLFGLRVIDIRGLHLDINQIVLRNLLRAVDSLPMFYLLGGIACLINRHAQRLGDLAANTIVIKEAKAIQPDLNLILEKNYYNSLREHPHLVARLRQQITAEEAGLALQALMRRNDLAPEERVDLFHIIARHFKDKVAFPQETIESVPSEQYVRNVIDVIFRVQR
ncbi:MAG: RDD family protein [Desulfobacteraceae bacterium]|nr:RDD family protein [Desulfobacteraceae bacterium]